MNAEILINVTPQETRVAVVENAILQDIRIERQDSRSIVGNIYKARVIRVLPGMEAAFVDIGLDKAGFLHLSNIDINRSATTKNAEEVLPTINTLLSEGQVLLVQVVKEPLGNKGARLTTAISVPSRYLVYLPNAEKIRISNKIEDMAERQRLQSLLSECLIENHSGGCIVRTAAAGVEPEELRRDIRFLSKLWNSLLDVAKKTGNCCCIHEDLSLPIRVLRDMVDKKTDAITVDAVEVYRKMRDFSQCYIPDLPAKILHYRGERPLFDLYSIDAEIQHALGRQVSLKSGGYLVIDQTEAMSTIDVNTGAYVGRKSLQETIFKTNLEASEAIARQLRLRNLGGIIMIDFIDMEQETHREQVHKVLGKHLQKDYASTHIYAVSPLGIIEMTRKRTRESLEHVLCEPCKVCHGRGSHKTIETVSFEIFREIMQSARFYDGAKELLVMASQRVVDCLLDELAPDLAELEALITIPVKLQVESSFEQETYDVMPV